MIDIHCHMLFSMDDGSQSIHESVAMVAQARENNIDAIVATPHFLNFGDIFDFTEERDAQIKTIQKILEERSIETVIAAGAEVFLDSRVFTADNLDELTINGSQYMLCEFSLKPFDTAHAIVLAEEIINRGYKIIIAHPERYIAFLNNPTVMNELYSMGAYFQLNSSSLAGHGGVEMQDFALDMIDRGFIDFIASDAHSVTKRNNKLLQKIAEFPDEITKEQIDYMLTTAPMKVLKNEVIGRRVIKPF